MDGWMLGTGEFRRDKGREDVSWSAGRLMYRYKCRRDGDGDTRLLSYPTLVITPVPNSI